MRVSTGSTDRRIQLLALAIIFTLMLPNASSARIVGDVVNAGFNARGGGFGARHVMRVGVWTPIVVRLTLEGQAQFNGRLRVAQRDRDGDVCYDYQEVVGLNAETRPTQKYTLYTLPATAADGELDIKVELLNQDGELVKMVSGGRLRDFIRPANRPTVLADDQDLILEISPGQMGKIFHLADPGQKIRPLHPINVAHIKPGDVPVRWQGLEAVDTIIWDEADPDVLNPAQRRALAEWTRQGGLLVLATARHAAALQKSDEFKEMLPVKVGPLTTLQEAKRLRDRWLDLPEEEYFYAEPIALAQCSLRKAPGVRRVFPVPGTEGESPEVDTLIARRRVGRGAVVFVAASLRDLIDPECEDPAKFFRSLLETRTASREDLYPERTLYKWLDSMFGFGGTTGGYLVFAMLFVLAYVGLSTFGSWGFLKARGWSKHNWSAFAILAGVASVVGMTAAQSIRGVGRKLNQLTIVDATAGASEARAIGYFGLKTGTHSVLDVWLAENYAQNPEPSPTDCFLRPLPMSRGPGDGGLSFADPGSYTLGPAMAELWRVPVRATLKQFEGRWRGDLLGRLDASIRITERPFEKSKDDPKTIVREECFDAGSTITNRLGVDLQSCFIFQPKANRYVGDGTVEASPRASGLSYEIVVHELADGILDGETIDLASRLYLDQDGDQRTWEDWHRSLLDLQNEWGRVGESVVSRSVRDSRKSREQENYKDVLLMATALTEYDEANSGITGGYSQQPIVFSRQRCRPLDLSNVLTDDMVLLVGFAEDAGPVSLCTRSNPGREYKRLAPKKAWTVYRIIIPVKAN